MKKISSKISLVMILCSFIVISVLGGISIFESHKLVRSDSEEKLTWMVRQYATQFSNELNIIENNVDEMEVYVRDTFDLKQLKDNPNYLSEYEQILDEYVFNFAIKRSSGIAAWVYFNPELSSTPHDVYYVDGNGDNIPERQNYIPFSYYDETPTQTDDKQWWYGTIHSTDGFWTNPYEWTLKNKEVIQVVSYAKPIYMENQLIGVVGTYYHFDKLIHTIQDIKVYDTGFASLYNEKLDVIVHPNYESGTRLNSENLATIEEGKYANIASKLLENEYGIVITDEKQSMAYSKLANEWVLMISPVAEEMFKDVNDLTYLLIVAVLICMLLSVLIASFTGRKITEPLRKVVQAAQKIGKGNLDVKIEVDTQDEMKTVADSLNEMVVNTKELQDKLMKMAYYDELTEIGNKNFFKYAVQDLLLKVGNQYAYVILDINKFKIINDVYGYIYGDLLLKHVASILQNEFYDDETVARFSGDIFHIFMKFTTRSDLQTRLFAIDKKIGEFKFSGNTDYHPSISFGIYVIENVSALVESMGDKAKLAVEKIKNNYTSSCYFYNDDIRNRILEEQEIENEMQTALERGDFKVYVQPKYSLKSMQIEGGEVLVRWSHPIKGIIQPDNFIPLFEKNKFITKLDMFMLESLAKKMREWLDMGRELVVISINQSRLHLHNPHYLMMIMNILNKYRIDPQWIEIEITESAFLEDMEKMIEMLNDLHELGFKISMDDFGSGYSSLNMLHEINVDVLKIDKKFFNDSSNSSRGKKIVDNIISMASDLNILVVAEGVETKDQVEFLMQTDCQLVQGYYFDKPMPIEQFEEKYFKKKPKMD